MNTVRVGQPLPPYAGDAPYAEAFVTYYRLIAHSGVSAQRDADCCSSSKDFSLF